MTLTVLAAQAAGGGGTSMIIMLVVMFAIMYFFMIRPHQKKQIRNFQNSLKVGQKVVTGGGVHGEVKKVELAEPLVEIEVAKGVVIKVEKSYVFAAAPEQK